jgi:type IV secretory pathway TrbL component
MPLINVLFILIVIGVVLWMVNHFIPMDNKIKSILNIIVVIGVVLWLLNAFGVLNSVSNIHIG